jgi:hypothetical protein
LPILVLLVARTALAASVPQAPEDDNQEYLLDIVTNQYSRCWREIYDAGDDRFRFRLGSNKVAQWFIEEELKLAAPLADRVRFRFHHARLLRYTTEEIGWDALEFEGQVLERLYCSLYARPTFDKRDSSLGLMFQHRSAVNEYVILSIEWPGFMRNFSEHRRETSDSLLNVFTNRPLRLGLDVREMIVPNIWVRAQGEFVPSFTMGEEINGTGLQIPKERAEAQALEGWVEYIVDHSRGVRDQTAFGIEAGHQRSRKSKDVDWNHSLRARDGEIATMGGDWGNSLKVRQGGAPHLIPENQFEDDLYERTDDDTASAWRDTRSFVSPYAWVPLGERVVLNATFRVEKREISVGNDAGETFYSSNRYVVPRLGVSYAMGDRRQYIVEGGLASEFRKQTDEMIDGLSPRVKIREDDFDDHRLYLSFEYVFGGSNLIRLNEGFELDAEDRGQFGIHDHGFFQLIIGF